MLLIQQIQDILSRTHLSGETWEAIFQQLQGLIFQIIDSSERSFRQQFLESFSQELSAENLLEKVAYSLSRAKQIEIHLWLGKKYEKLGIWDKALDAFDAAITLSDEPALAGEKAEALRWSGHIHCMQNNWAEARQAYQDSLKICQAGQALEGEAQALNSLGILEFEQGQLEKADDHWQRALELAEKLQETGWRPRYTTIWGRWPMPGARPKQRWPVTEKACRALRKSAISGGWEKRFITSP